LQQNICFLFKTEIRLFTAAPWFETLFYTHLSIQIQISKVFRVAFYHLKRIAKIRKYISRPATARPITRYWLVAESSACGCLLHHWSTPL
jgi:hypothetical protein